MERIVEIPGDRPIWEQVFTVAPLVLVGTREPDGAFDLAPKHMAMPLGWQELFCFVCSPRHRTHANIVERGEFAVSFPTAEQIVSVGQAAAPRDESDAKPALQALPTRPASHVDAPLVEGSYLYLECTRDRILDDFGDHSLIIGRVVSASVPESLLRRYDVDDADLLHGAGLPAFVSPARFAVLDETFSFPFPIDFHR